MLSQMTVNGITGYVADGVVSKTQFVLTLDNPYTHIPIEIEGNYLDASHATLIELAKEHLFKTWFADKALPDTIIQVDALNSKMVEVDEQMLESRQLIEQLNEFKVIADEKLTQIDAVATRTQEMLRTVSLTLNELILASEDDDDDDTDNLE